MNLSQKSEKSVLDICGALGMKYKVLKLLGSGSFGDVYLGQHKKSGELVAIKCEDLASSSRLLKNETKIYHALNGGEGIANVRWYGVDSNKTYVVLDLLGNSLDDLKNKYKYFSLKTTLLLGLQLINRIEYIHGKGFLHRDIKPENFMFGRNGLKKNTLYAIDFGLSKPYLNRGVHVSNRNGRKMVGTPRYASLNIHNGNEYSRRDDLISIGYMIIYLFKGILPWQGQKGETKYEKYKNIFKVKKDVSILDLCDTMCYEMNLYLEYCYELSFNDNPNYEFLRKLFKRALQKNNLEQDFIYDWTT